MGAVAFNGFDTLLAPFVKKDKLGYTEVKQSMQNFIFSVNSNSRAGAEPAFFNLTFDLTPPEDKMSNIEITPQAIVQNYLSNPITQAVVCGGLEPMDSFDDLYDLVKILRKEYHCNDTVVIYTGYNKDEILGELDSLQEFSNIVVKFGRFIPNQSKHYDAVLGVTLASDNQYAEVIS